MTKAATLASVNADRAPHAEIGQEGRGEKIGMRRLAAAPKQVGHRRQDHQRQHHREIFDDQPADGDAPALRLDHAPVLQCLQQHDRACHRKGEAED